MLKHFISPKGCVNKKTFQLYFLFLVATAIFVGRTIIVIDDIVNSTPDSTDVGKMLFGFFIGIAFCIFTIISFPIFTIKRLHDLGKSGFWILFFFAIALLLTATPVILVFYILTAKLYLLFASSKIENNKYRTIS